ncbi:MAG: PAS domain S-box protein [Methanomicrobiales archaeon]|nr:PAS domain S-box protein [Methanomicrobiales archaeon]MDI6876110.1 PAS domain S-box protein [Methanomicrobiales archaeon]
MQQEHQATAKIVNLLRFKQKGMTISELSRKARLNRHSVAKYLEILLTSGRVEVDAIGNAKVYRLSKRVPLSAFMNFTAEFILVLDEDLHLVQVDDHYLDFIGCVRDAVLGRRITEITLPLVTDSEICTAIRSGIREGIEFADLVHARDALTLHFKGKVLPTAFEGGNRGLTIVLEDITREKELEEREIRHLESIEFLAQAAMQFVRLHTEEDIYGLIGEGLHDLIPQGIAVVNAYNPISGALCVRGVQDERARDLFRQVLGRDIVGMGIPADPLAVWDLARTATIRRPQAGDHDVRHLYDVTAWGLPEKTSDALARALGMEEIYVAGLAWEGQLYGSITVFLPGGADIGDESTIDSFINLSSMALRRMIAEDALHDSEQRFRDVADLSPYPIAIIDRNGEYCYINRKFTETFGYTRRDIPDGRAWFARAFPDPEYRRQAVETWKSDLARASVGEVRMREFDVRCKNGTVKPIVFRPVTLSDGNQYVTYEDMTEKRRAEEALLDANCRLQDIIEFLPDATFVIDSDRRVIAWNRAMEDLTGVARGEMLGKSDFAYALPFYGRSRPLLIDLVGGSDPAAESLYRVFRREGESVMAEGYLTLSRDGRRRLLQGRASPLYDRHGNRVGAIQSIRDITGLRRRLGVSRQRTQPASTAARIHAGVRGSLPGACGDGGRHLS